MRVLSVVGARPQFVKLSPVAKALDEQAVDHVIVHTGQHYHENMSAVFFSELRIPAPTVSLGIGSGTHGVQTAEMLKALEPVLIEQRPDWVLIYGDTNSTLAAAVCATKLHLPVAHLEAGLRSFNRVMPEEINRILADHASDLLMAPTNTAMDNLRNEGLADKSVLVGDVMVDVCLEMAARTSRQAPQDYVDGIEPGQYFFSTIHRPSNTDDPRRLRELIGALQSAPLPVVLAVHPRLRQASADAGIELDGGNLRAIDPLGYPGTVVLLRHSRSVITDSGGIQKEAYILGRPCTTLKGETEWIETLEGGWNVLQASAAGVLEAAMRPVPDGDKPWDFGDGQASNRVASLLVAGLDPSH